MRSLVIVLTLVFHLVSIQPTMGQTGPWDLRADEGGLDSPEDDPGSSGDGVPTRDMSSSAVIGLGYGDYDVHATNWFEKTKHEEWSGILGYSRFFLPFERDDRPYQLGEYIWHPTTISVNLSYADADTKLLSQQGGSQVTGYFRALKPMLNATWYPSSYPDFGVHAILGYEHQERESADPPTSYNRTESELDVRSLSYGLGFLYYFLPSSRIRFDVGMTDSEEKHQKATYFHNSEYDTVVITEDSTLSREYLIGIDHLVEHFLLVDCSFLDRFHDHFRESVGSLGTTLFFKQELSLALHISFGTITYDPVAADHGYWVPDADSNRIIDVTVNYFLTQGDSLSAQWKGSNGEPVAGDSVTVSSRRYF